MMMQCKYDYLIVGAGLFGSVIARKLKDGGKDVLVVEKRDHIGGNIYTEIQEGIDVHKYGAHIFHTSNEEVWKFVNKYAIFNDYKHSVKANYKGKIYDLPFNMNTFRQIWNVDTVEEARKIIDKQKGDITEPKNLEEQCVSMVGKDIYEKLVKGYTEKQWGRECKDLPSFIIRRLPVRFEFNNNYFNDTYQGIPVGGYTEMIRKMLEGIEVRLNYDYLLHRNDIDYEYLIYTGPIDEYFDYCFGPLQYRSLRFETEVLNTSSFQGTSVVNYTDRETPYTRIIEHKYFNYHDTDKTIITKEYPSEWKPGEEAYYPINDEINNELHRRYLVLAAENENICFGGRLGEYKYYDMDKVIEKALNLYEDLSNKNQ